MSFRDDVIWIHFTHHSLLGKINLSFVIQCQRLGDKTDNLFVVDNIHLN